MRNGPPRGEGDPTAQYVPSTFPGATKTEKKREGPGYDKYLLYININYIININIYPLPSLELPRQRKRGRGQDMTNIYYI